MTRMRFVLNDESKADVAGIEDLPSAKGSFTQSGQFQVIIGNDVKAFYEDFVAVSGIEGVTKDAAKAAAKQNQNPIQRAMTVIAEVFAPIIPAIIVGGLILGFRNCIDSVYVFGDGTQTLVQTSQFWAGLDSFLWLIGEAVFHTGIPVGICWSVTKKMGGTPMLGIVLGLTLISGQLLNAYSVSSTPTSQIPQWDFGFAKVNMIGYQAQVIPAILAAVTLGLLERFFRKISFPFVCGMVGSCIAGLLSVATSCTANAVGVGGLPGILSMQPTSWAMFAVCMVIAAAVPFVLTVVVGKKKGIEDEARAGAAAIAAELASEGK